MDSQKNLEMNRFWQFENKVSWKRKPDFFWTKSLVTYEAVKKLTTVAKEAVNTTPVKRSIITTIKMDSTNTLNTGKFEIIKHSKDDAFDDAIFTISRLLTS